MFTGISDLPDNENIFLSHGLSFMEPEDSMLDRECLGVNITLAPSLESEIFYPSKNIGKNYFANHNAQSLMNDWFDGPQSLDDELTNQASEPFQEFDFGLLEQKERTFTPEPQIRFDEVTESCTGKFSPADSEYSGTSSLTRKQEIIRKKIQKTRDEPALTAKKSDSKIPKSPFSKLAFKNIVKNYGKAMAAFSLSETAGPYLQLSLSKHEVKMEAFRNFMINQKESIECIGILRNLLYANPATDKPEEMKLKSVFRDISEVFVRDFAVNWIFSSKIKKYKSQHLECRLKILRRVRDPVNFTYLKSQ